MKRSLRATALVMASVGCSGGSNSAPQIPPLPIGIDFSPYLPMQPGDVYEFSRGLVLRIEPATHRGFGTAVGQVMRVAFEAGPVQFGYYLSHGDARGTLMHGVFDTGIDQEVLFDTPQPLWLGFGTIRRTLVVQSFKPIGSSKPLVSGTAVLRHVRPNASTIPPPNLYYSTPFARWRVNEVAWPHWELTFDPTVAHRDLEIQMGCGPGFGPVVVILGGQPFTAIRLRRPGHVTADLLLPK